ncbi:MAG TPA: bifunctional UDP-sugar hydrolase/5'-nucleotidase [Bryobacteraceae bacterium]|nr:bifunctional UDP-sugar hydrolase/5'-nucleotidase [Bryobacteraceae bacterium]
MRKWTGRLLAAVLAVSQVPAAVRTVTILHTNDVHARLSALADGRGGFAALAAVIRNERAQCTGCILLNAGDLVQGSPVSTIFHGLPVFEIANMLGFDAATLGNHDFDYGWMQARRFVQAANYPIVSANVIGSDGQLFTPRPYVILRANGVRVAVIGAMTDDLHNLTTPSLMGEWHESPMTAAVRKYAAQLRGESDLVVLLGHITSEEEQSLLRSAPQIPVLVTGHVHNGLEHEITREGRILVRVKAYGEELGRLELQVDTEKKAPVAWTWKRIPVDGSIIPPAADVAAQVSRWEEEVSRRVDRPLAISARKFDQAAVRLLIEQAMREETGADFAFLNAGGVRDTLPEGQLLVRNIWDIMPFDNRVVFGKFKGRDLPPAVLRGRRVDPDHQYTLAVTDFTAANQSAEEQLQTRGLEFSGDGGLLRDLLVDWFGKKKRIE